MTVAEGSAGINSVGDIYLMMKANIWTVPGRCLYEYSNYGSFASTVDLESSASRQVLSIPVPRFLPLGPGIPVSHVLSARLQAPLRPAQLSSLFLSLSSHPTPLDSFCVSPSTTSVLGEHSTFYRPFSLLSRFPALNFPYLKVSSADGSCCTGTFCLIWLTSNLVLCVSFFLAGVRRATMGYAATSLYPRQMLSCQTQVRSHFFILQYLCIDLRR